MQRFNYVFRFSLAFLLGLITISSFAQGTSLKPVAAKVEEFRHSRSAKSFNLFEPTINRQKSEEFHSVLSESTVLQLKKSSLKELMATNASFIELTIPYGDRELTLELYEHNILADGFFVTSTSSNGHPIAYPKGRYFRGIVKGDNQSLAAISFFDNELMGMVSTQSEHNIVISRIDNPNNFSDYIVYSDANLKIHNPSSCHAEEIESYEELSKQIIPQTGSKRAGCVNLYLETDFKLYQSKGNSTSSVISWITSAFNNVSTLYANEQVDTDISEIYVWTTQDNYSTSSSNTALNQFKAARPNPNGDLAQLCALAGGNNGLGGIAFLSGLCNNFRYSYAGVSGSYSQVPAYSWTIEVMAHEIGHNLSSPHTHSCTWPGGAIDNCYTTEGGCAPGPPPTNGGTVMSYCHLASYGINFNNGFGTLPGNKIRSYVAGAGCLGGCSGGGGGGQICDVPTNIKATNITAYSALISWDGHSNALSYILKYKLATSSVWTTISNITATSYQLNGLQLNTTYNYKITAVCSFGNSDESSEYNFTTLNNCGVPQDISATPTSPSEIFVQWDPVVGANSYILQYRKSFISTWTDISGLTIPFYSLMNLSSNTTYKIRIKVICPNAPPGISGEVEATTLDGCGTPDSLKVTNITSTTALASWLSISSAGSYNLQYKPVTANTWTTVSSANTSYSITGLVPSTDYVCRVQAVCGQNSSNYSNEVPFRTYNVNNCPNPSNVVISNITTNGASVTWTGTSTAISYELQYKKTTELTWATISTTLTTYSLTGLSPLTTYNVRVRAICSNGSSDYTPIVDFTTLTDQPCAVPSNLNASNITSSSAVLSWGAVAGASSYDLQYRPETTNNWTILTGITTNSKSVSGLQSGMTYYFRVRTICQSDTSAYSAEATFTTLGSVTCGVPTNLSATNITSNSALIKWTASGASSYKVQYRKNGTVVWSYVISSSTQITLSGLDALTQYQYRVQSICFLGSSNYSSISTFTTLGGGTGCDKPTGLNVTNIGYNSARVNWAAVQGATGYEIRYKGVNNDTVTRIIATDSITKFLQGLRGGNNYIYFVKTKCGNQNSPESDTGYFSTLNPCSPVSNLRASWISSTKVGLVWDSTSLSPVSQWYVRYKLKSETAWTDVPGWVDTNYVEIRNLKPDSSYWWQVRSDCAEGSSAFQDTGRFTLNSPCLNPSNLTISNISTNSATANWVGQTNVSYLFQFKNASDLIWTNATVTATTYNMTGLSPATSYDAQVRAICVRDTSSIAGPVSFTTSSASDCPAPTNVNADKISTYSAVIKWNNIAGVLSYTVQYRPVGTSTWITKASFGNTITLYNLTSSTTYEVQVGYKCKNNSSSPYSTPVQFTTLSGLEFSKNVFVELAPNPTTGKAILTLNGDLQEAASIVQVFDSRGQLMNQYQLDKNQHTQVLETSELPAGIYFVKVLVQDQVITKRLIKQ